MLKYQQTEKLSLTVYFKKKFFLNLFLVNIFQVFFASYLPDFKAIYLSIVVDSARTNPLSR